MGAALRLVFLGLPRTRGDRPCRASAGGASQRAPPHARGSTQQNERSHAGVVGSPARAGIDPAWAHGPTPMLWLPRTRGDRPRSGPCRRQPPLAPPHARGSTHDGCSAWARWAGSPARAGIDPVETCWRSDNQRLPRTRGDRPTIFSIPKPFVSAPPHARGSTPSTCATSTPRTGSPARAGIDLAHSGFVPLLGRLPRTRGDRPQTAPVEDGGIEAPPHARGSTRRHRLERCDVPGSPARAGIDL